MPTRTLQPVHTSHPSIQRAPEPKKTPRKPKSIWHSPCAMAATVSKVAHRGWREASEQSLAEQKHLFSSVVSLFALNPLVLPAILLAWLLTLSKLLTRFPVVRTVLYILAVCWSHAVIGAIRLVTPCCFAYAAYSLLHHAVLPSTVAASLPILSGWVHILTIIYCSIEIAFYFHTIHRARRLQKRVSGPFFTNARRWLVFRRVEEASHCILPMAMPKSCVYWKKFRALRHGDSEGRKNNTESMSASAGSAASSDCPLEPFGSAEERHPLEFLRGWFLNLPLKHIKHDNLMTFFAESTLGLHLNELTPGQRNELEEIVRYIQLKATRHQKNCQIRSKHIAKLRENLVTQKCLSEETKHPVNRFNNVPPVDAQSLRAGRVTLALPDVHVSSSSSQSSDRSTSLIPSSSTSSSSPIVSDSPDPTSFIPPRADSTSPECSSNEESSGEESAVSPCVSRRASRAGSANSSGVRVHSRRNDVSSSEDEADEENADDSNDWATHLSLGTLPPGHEAAHDPMKLNLAPVQYLHRPLAIYAGVSGLGLVAAAFLRFHGFTHHTQGKLSYWYRRAVLSPLEVSNETPRADPLVLIHGIGIGPFTYLHMLNALSRTKNPGTCGERSLYVLELPSIAMQLNCDDVPSPLDHVQSIAEMLHVHEMAERELYHPFSHRRAEESVTSFFARPQPSLDEIQQSAHPIKAVFVGHSYGTFVTSWVIKNRPDLVSSTFLIDPVCFLVFDPSLIYNFIYRTPFSLVTSIYNFFTSKELGISHTLCRHFYWYENVLWREELERIGMSPTELDLSLIAEREQCVASLPYHELLSDESTIQETVELVRRSGSDGTASRPSTPKLPSYAAAVADSIVSESPLCPAHSLGPRVYVYLASNDDITPSGSIQKYLTHSQCLEESKWGRGESMIRFKVFDGIGHAECLFHSTMKNEIIAQIQHQPSHEQLVRELQLKVVSKSMRTAQTPM